MTCDVCSFLRNDPLATPEAINDFIDIVWGHIKPSKWRSESDRVIDTEHSFMIALRNHILEAQ